MIRNVMDTQNPVFYAVKLSFVHSGHSKHQIGSYA